MEIELGSYSFTFTIPSFKVVYYNGQKIPYGKLSQENQYKFIEDIIQMNIGKFDEIEWVYEEHEDKRLHVHGYIQNTHEELVKDFVNNFYTYNSRIGLSFRSYSKLSVYEKTRHSLDSWLRYIQKHQAEIKFLSKRRQDEKDSADLDYSGNAVKIETNYYDTYRFKGKNNFLVEI